MSTNLLSFLLLKKFRHGIEFGDLVKEMAELRKFIFMRKRDVGFFGDIAKVTERAVSHK